MTYSASFLRRFWARVEKSRNGCWLWTGSVYQPYGYGQLSYRYQKLRAHRVSFELHYGRHPEGRFVCHHCDTPRCVRPDHLFLGDALANNVDMAVKGRGRARLTPEIVARIKSHPDRYGVAPRLAERYGVTEQSIRAVLRGESWSWVKPRREPRQYLDFTCAPRGQHARAAS